MSDPNARPRPQYGEYASPEEQRASIQVPADIAHDEPVPIARTAPLGHQPDSNQPSANQPGANQPGANQPGWQQPAQHPSVPPRSGPRTPAAARPGDRIITVALLAVGLFNVVSTVPGLIQLSNTISATFQQMGIGDFTPTTLAQVFGIGLAVFYIVAWILTLLLAVARLRTGRLAFWIPLSAGVIVMLVSMACFLVLFLNDPGFVAYMTKNV